MVCLLMVLVFVWGVACENRIASAPTAGGSGWGDADDVSLPEEEASDDFFTGTPDDPFQDEELFSDDENSEASYGDDTKDETVPDDDEDLSVEEEPSLDTEEPVGDGNDSSFSDDVVSFDGAETGDDAGSVDDTPLTDDAALPDSDVISDACQKDDDCGFGYRCDTAANPNVCLWASTCTNDFDCSIYESCEVVGNWKECRFNLSESCQSNADCKPGEVCETIFLTFKACRSYNECETDAECPDGKACVWNGSFRECVAVCQKDEDCGFGYRCVSATPHNICEYANECTSDTDCPAFYTCQSVGNWNACRFSTGGTLCTSDADCAPDEYCDLSMGFFGTCKSRNQCTIDADCGANMTCQFNGTYNECVPKKPTQCLFDFQCPEGWSCVENVCKPQYAGVCTEIEGMWHVLMSTTLFFENGAAYEFIPQNGCNGSIKKEGDLTATGSFTQVSPAHYTLTMLLIFTCSADITLNTLMSITCSSGTATLVHY